MIFGDQIIFKILRGFFWDFFGIFQKNRPLSKVKFLKKKNLSFDFLIFDIFWGGLSCSLDYVLKMDHFPNLTRDSTWPPNHETQFDFTLESVCNFLQLVYFRPICPVSSRPHQNCRSWRKCCINPRAKLKYFL